MRPGAVWKAMPDDVRALLVLQVSDTIEPHRAPYVGWDELSPVERSLIGTMIRAFGRACSGAALGLGLQ